jgi:hypothetical protein
LKPPLHCATVTVPAKVRDALFLFLITFGAVAVHGYHYGVQDQFLYIPAVKKHLDSGLYLQDGSIFLVHTSAMLADDLVALFARVTRLPVDWTVFLWHVASLYLLLLGCLRVSKRCFPTPSAQWAATSLVAAMLTLEVAATLLFLADNYFHPRTLATGALLFALAAVLDRSWLALGWLAAAALMHPTMAAAGALHLGFIAFWPRRLPIAVAVMPFAMLGETNDAWRELMTTRWYLYPLNWPWYAWIGVVVPAGLLCWFARMEKDEPGPASHVSTRLLYSGLVGVTGGIFISVTPGLERLIPTEPMRSLHFLTLLTVLLGGGILGERLLHDRPLRWAVLLAPICAAFLVAQTIVLFPAGPHIEWPSRVARNSWTEAFEWVRRHTPRDAYFALGATYQELPGQDFHSFRALAERSALLDYSKDRSVVANWPQLAPSWREQVRDQEGWPGFTITDFQRLKQKYGVTWVVLQTAHPAVLDCPYQNDAARVCRVP